MKLYTYWRSTTSYRVRIALHLKGIDFESHTIDLTTGEQRSSDYTSVNPIQGVPSLQLSDDTVLTQSMAILRYLEAISPTPALWPENPIKAAEVEAAAQLIATDIHPVNNLKVTRRLKALGQEQIDTVEWMNHWMQRGLTAFAALLPSDQPFCFGDKPGLADICLVPQLYNAHRWGTTLEGLETLTDIEQRCLSLPAFDKARPERQPDAQPSP